MKIFPAVDLRDGRAVRLFQGDYDKETVYSDKPIDVVRGFEAAGARYLHLVDLDGAKDDALVNYDIIKEITSKTKLFVEVGGGIRDEKRICQYLDAGVDRVILGTIAVRDRDFLEAMVEKYGDRIAVGVDAKNGKVAVSGWTEVTNIDSFEFCQYLESIGVAAVIYTDISRDGAEKGTNMEVYKQLSSIKGIAFTASGGISFEEEISELKNITDAAILGKALYTGKLDLKKCIEIAGDQEIC